MDIRQVMSDGILAEFTVRAAREGGRPATLATLIPLFVSPLLPLLIYSVEPNETQAVCEWRAYHQKLYEKYSARVPNFTEIVDGFYMNLAALGDFVTAVSSFHNSKCIYADYMRIYAHIRCLQPLLGPVARSSTSSTFMASNTSSISMEITYSTHSAPPSMSEVPNCFADSITFKWLAYCALSTACKSLMSMYCHSSGALRWLLIHQAHYDGYSFLTGPLWTLSTTARFLLT